MANLHTRAVVDLEVNGQQARREMDDLTRRIEKTRKEMERYAAAGDSKGAARKQRELERLERQMRRLRDSVSATNDTLRNLDRASLSELQNALRQLQRQIRGMRQGTAEWDAHAEAIRRVRAQIDRCNSAMRATGESTGALGTLFSTWQGKILGVAGTITGFTAAVKEFTGQYADMEQEMANVRKYTGMTEDEVWRLNEEFKRIDTRTSREDLNRLAQEAGRLGKTSVEDVLAFVRAADKINVALDDLGDGATLTLSKLTGIFGDEERLGTERALLSVGSVINELSQNCSASAPYLAEFASRMGGVGAQAGMTVQQIMAYAAVLDSANINVEKSSTALQQVVTRLYQEPAKYAAAAGLDAKRFAELVRTDMNAALIEFLGTLSEAGGMDKLSPMLKEMGENGSGATATLSTLAARIGEVKAQQEAANQAFAEATSIDKEAAVQNETVQASLEKSKKELHEVSVELGENLLPLARVATTSATAMMRALSALVGFVMENKVAVVTLIGLIAGWTIALKANAIAAAATNAVHLVTKGIMVVLNPLIKGAQLAWFRLTRNTRRAAVAQRDLNRAMSENVIGLIITVIAMAAAAYLEYARKMAEARKEQQRQREEDEQRRKSLTDLTEATIRNSKQEADALKSLYEAATDENRSRKERIEAVNELQRQYPAYFGNLRAEEIMVGKAKDQYEELAKSIIKSARAKAALDKIKENEEQRLLEEVNLAEAREEYAPVHLEIEKAQARYEAARHAQDEAVIKTSFNSSDERRIDADRRVYNARQDIIEAKAKAVEVTARLEKAKSNIADIDKANQGIIKAVGLTPEQIRKSKAEDNKLGDVEPTALNGTGGGGGTSSGGHNGSDPIAEWREMEEAKAKTAYAIGQTDYLEHTARMDEIAVEYYKKQLERTGLSELERAKITAQWREAEKKQRENRTAESLEIEKRRHASEAAQLKQDYIDSLISRKTYDRQAEEEELKHLANLAALQTEGSREQADTLARLRDRAMAARKKKEEEFEKALAKYSLDYQAKSAKEKLDMQLRILDELHERGLMKEKEYKEAKSRLRRDTLAGELPASARKPEGAATTDQREKEDDLAKLKSQYDAKLLTEEEYLKARERVEAAYEKKALERAKQSGNEYSAMLVNLVEAFAAFGDESDDRNPLLKMAGAAQASFAIMSAAMSAYQEYSRAALEAETARIERRYNRESALAEGNVYKQKEAEKKKNRELAKAKNDANRKQFAMQVIQGVAQTATNALAAYGSALAVPGIGYILAPIAAAMAVAAGMAQVATIRKQQQASEAQGYMQGGFTPAGRKDEAVGVVHAGEWVAPRELLQNRETRPMIDLLERARRGNRMASITAADVSASVTAQARGARAAVQTVAVIREPQERSYTAPRLAESIEALNARLAEPFYTVNTVSGDHGMRRALDEYDRLMKNKSR